MMDCIVSRFEFDRARTCMVGDRMDTDIQFGIDGGLGGTLLVLTGVANETDMKNVSKENRPKYYLDSLGDLLKYL